MDWPRKTAGTGMFIERSASRIRLMRTLFVLLGLGPCAGLCGWAVFLCSGVHRHAVERRCEQVLGLPVAIGGVEHVRPNVMRLHDCRLHGESGAVILKAPMIEVESSARELRVTFTRFDCTPELARVARRLTQEWLWQPARFPVDCVVDLEDFSWRHRLPPPAGVAPAGDQQSNRGRSRPLHVECVAANGSRAVRVRRAGEPSGAADEVRVVSGPLVGSDGEDATARPETTGNLGVTGTVMEPVPIAVFEALAGLEAGALPFGDEAVVSGSIDAVMRAGRPSGSAEGHVERVDLAAASRYLPHRASGEATLAFDEVAWRDGRVTTCACRFAVSRGRVGQKLLDACVAALGCRPGPAYRSLAREEVRSFDDVAVSLRIDPAGVDLRAGPDRSGSLARSQGLSLIDEPRSLVPPDRLAWLFAPPGAVAVPASAVSAWLLGFFKLDVPVTPNLQERAWQDRAGPVTPSVSPGTTQDDARSQAVRPLRRSEF